MKINQKKAAVVISYVGMFLTIFISLIYTPVKLRLLGQEEYGLFQLVSSMVAYFSILNLGLPSAYMRFYVRYCVSADQEGLQRLNGMFLSIFILIGLFTLVCGLWLSTQFPRMFADSLSVQELQSAQVLMVIMVVNTAIAFLFHVFGCNINANEHHFFLKLLDLGKTVLLPLCTLPFLLLGYGSLGMVVISFFVSLGMELLYCRYALKKLRMKFQFGKFSRPIMGEIWVYCSFLILNLVSERLNWDVDKFLLGLFQGTAAVAVYSISAQIKTYYLTFSNAISTVFVPQVFGLVAQGGKDEEISLLFNRIGRLQFLVLSLIMGGIFLIGKPFILFWAGDEYGEAYLILLIMIVPSTIPNIQSLGTIVQDGKNMHKFRCVLYLCIAICNVIITIPLCQSHGAVGCAIGTAMSTLLGHGLIMNIYYQKKVGIDVISFWKEIILLSRGLILPYCLGLLFFLTIDTSPILNFLLVGSSYTLVFAVSMWFFGMNESEKNLLQNGFKSVKNHLLRR